MVVVVCRPSLTSVALCPIKMPNRTPPSSMSGGNAEELRFGGSRTVVKNLSMDLFFLGCFPGSPHEGKRPVNAISGKRLVRAGKFRNFEKGAFARRALRKFVANCTPNLLEINANFVSYVTGRVSQNCIHLSQIRKSISDNFMQIPFSNAAFSKFQKKKSIKRENGPLRPWCWLALRNHFEPPNPT